MPSTPVRATRPLCAWLVVHGLDAQLGQLAHALAEARAPVTFWMVDQVGLPLAESAL